MSTRVASSNSENFRIKGELDELTPLNKTGLVSHVNFEGGLSYHRTLLNAKVLLLTRSIDTEAILISYGCIVTTQVYNDITSIVNATCALTVDIYSQYDLIIVNGHVWSLSSSCFDKFAEIIDYGISVFSIGNDTSTSRYAKSTLSITGTGKNIVLTPNHPFKYNGVNYYSERLDGKQYITSLSDEAIPIGITDGDKIYLYLVEDTASLIHDNDVNLSTVSDLFKSMLEYLVSRSLARIIATGDGIIPYSKNGYISIENHTNLWNGLTYTNKTSGWSVIDNFAPNCPFIENTNYKLIRCEPRNGMVYYNLFNTDGVNYPIGTTFTFSAWVFVEPNFNGSHVRLQGESKTIGNCYYDLNKKGTWQFLSFKCNSVSEGFYFLLYVGTGSSTWTTGNVYYANVQLSKSGFTKEFTNINFIGKDVTIPVNNLGTSFTTIVKLKRMLDFKGTVSVNTNKSVFNLYDTITGKPITYQDYYKTDGYNAPWYGHDSFMTSTDGGYWHHHFDYDAGDFDVNDDEFLIYCKNNNTFSVFIYRNGILYSKLSTTYTMTELINFSLDKIKLYNTAHSYFKDVLIYNKNLSSDEINNICKPKQLSLNLDGNIYEKAIIESPIVKDADIYFPLSYTNEDYYGFKTPKVSNSLIFDNNSVVVTNNCENRYLYPQFAVSTSLNTPINYNNLLNEHTITLTTSDSGTYRGIDLYPYGSNHMLLNTNTRYELTFEVYCDYIAPLFVDFNSKPQNLTQTTNDNVLNIVGNDTFYTEPGKWVKKRILFTIKNDDNYYVHDRIFVTNDFTIPHFMKIKFRNVCYRTLYHDQVQHPYVPCTISSGKLQFNLYESIGLDWSGNWTIIYNKMPIIGANNAIENNTNYVIDTIGCNNNSVGGKYYWFGKNNNTNAIHLSTQLVSINSLEYFNSWHTVVLKKQDNALTYTVYLKNDIKTINITTDISTANAFVTQHGYDLMLGGWDDNTSGTSAYRDLMVFKKALNQEEINTVVKTFLQVKSNSIQINNELIEKSIL